MIYAWIYSRNLLYVHNLQNPLQLIEFRALKDELEYTIGGNKILVH